MEFSGFQKLTLLDFPGKVACTLFTHGCNLRCPFCHNASLVLSGKEESYSEKEVLSYFKKRAGVLDGVCITGGEPLMQPELFGFLSKLKELGLSIKVDTNGTFSKKLSELLALRLCDYVAMDIKNSKEKYGRTVGLSSFDVSEVEKSVSLLMESGCDYEFRTTVADELHDVEDIEKIAGWIKGARRYFLQSFVDSGNIIGKNLTAPSHEKLYSMRDVARNYVCEVGVRGI